MGCIMGCMVAWLHVRAGMFTATGIPPLAGSGGLAWLLMAMMMMLMMRWGMER